MVSPFQSTKRGSRQERINAPVSNLPPGSELKSKNIAASLLSAALISSHSIPASARSHSAVHAANLTAPVTAAAGPTQQLIPKRPDPPKPGDPSWNMHHWNLALEKARRSPNLNRTERKDLGRWTEPTTCDAPMCTDADATEDHPPSGGDCQNAKEHFSASASPVTENQRPSSLAEVIKTTNDAFNKTKQKQGSKQDDEESLQRNIVRVLAALEMFGKVGDVMVQHNPTIVSLAWGGFRFLLQVCALLCLITRRSCTILRTLICSAPSMLQQRVPQFSLLWKV